MLREPHPQSSFDWMLPFAVDTTLEAAYIDEKLRSQGVTLGAVDPPNPATAHAEGATFVTHNRCDFDGEPV